MVDSRFWQFANYFLTREREHQQGEELAGHAHGQLGHLAQVLDKSVRKSFLSPSVRFARARDACGVHGHCFHRLNASEHSLPSQEVLLLGPQLWAVVLPELLKVFLELVDADRLQVVAEQIAKADLLFAREVFLRLRTHRRLARRL